MIDVEGRVKGIIVEQLGVEAEHVILEARFAEDLEADSLDRLELRLVLEDVFDVKITDDQQDALLTVGDVVAFLNHSHPPDVRSRMGSPA